MRDYKTRVESYSREMLRKDSQIKELQGRIEGDGCKYLIRYSACLFYIWRKFIPENNGSTSFGLQFTEPRFWGPIQKRNWDSSVPFYDSRLGTTSFPVWVINRVTQKKLLSTASSYFPYLIILSNFLFKLSMFLSLWNFELIVQLCILESHMGKYIQHYCELYSIILYYIQSVECWLHVFFL